MPQAGGNVHVCAHIYRYMYNSCTVHVWQQNCLDFNREPFGVKECALPRPYPTFIYMHYTPVQCRYMYSLIPKAMCCHLPVQTSKTNTQQKRAPPEMHAVNDTMLELRGTEESVSAHNYVYLTVMTRISHAHTIINDV